jgi:hypothetical protein
MNRQPLWVYTILILSALFLALVFFLTGNRKKRVDWRQSYTIEHKKPYGLYIFNDLLPKLLPNSRIIPATRSPENSIAKLKEIADSEKKSTQYIIVTGVFDADSNETDQLLNAVYEDGMQLFIASYDINDFFLKQLSINATIHSNVLDFYSHSQTPNNHFIHTDSLAQYQLVDSAFSSSEPVKLNKAGLKTSIELTANNGFQVLGTNDSNKVNFVAIPHGTGVVLIHTNPLIFSNYNWLQPQGATYARGVSRYLKDSSVVLLDQYFSQKRPNQDTKRSAGLLDNLSFIWAQPDLRTALLLTLAGILIYFFFTAKRKQRIVPVIPIERNTTTDFTAVLASLYLKSKPHKTIGRKLVYYWLDTVRQKLHIEFTGWSIEFCTKVRDKSGAPISCIQSIMGSAQLIEEPIEFSAADLQSLHAEIKTYFDAVQQYDKSSQS